MRQKFQKNIIEIVLCQPNTPRHWACLTLWIIYPVEHLVFQETDISFVSICYLQIVSQLWVGGTLCRVFPFIARTLLGCNLCTSCVCCHILCEFICTSILLCLLYTVSLLSYITSGSYNLFSHYGVYDPWQKTLDSIQF